MRIIPTPSSEYVVEGEFFFRAATEAGLEVQDTFSLRIEVPDAYPKVPPLVREIGGRIPHKDEYHINQTQDAANGTLCLGSPFQLAVRLAKDPSLAAFAKSCIVPFLYAISVKLKNGGPMIFGELDHGKDGLRDDYYELFLLDTEKQVIQALQLLSLRVRIANKKDCPHCGKHRYGQCSYRRHLNLFRSFRPRSWFAQQINYFL